MATVIDALVVTLGLDPKAYQKGRKDVAAGMKDLRESSSKTAKEMEEQGKRAAAFFSSVRTELLALLATFGAATGIKDFIASNTLSQASLGRQSQNLGIATQRLQAYQTVARGVGESAGAVGEAFQNIAHGVAQAQIGHTEFFQNAWRYGVAINGGMSYEQILEKIGERMRQLNAEGPRGTALARDMAQSLGVGGLSQALLLPGFDKEIAQAAALSRVTGKSAEQAEKLQMEWEFLRLRISGVVTTAFNKLEPVLIKIGNAFAKWLDSVKWDRIADKIGVLAQRIADWFMSLDWSKVIRQAEQLGESIKKWIVSIDWRQLAKDAHGFAQGVIDIVDKLGGLKTVAIALAAILGARLLTPLLSVGRAIFGIVGFTASATTGVTALAGSFTALGAAVAAAAAAGGIIGHEIWKHLLEGTKAGDATGSFVTHVMAQLGDKNAQEAILREEGKGPVNHSGDYHPERASWYKEKQSEAMKYFVSQGWSRAQAAAIVANLGKESTFNQNAVGDNGQAYGIAQWHKDRQAIFEKWLGRQIKGSSFHDQLAFVNYELTHGEKRAGDMLRNATNAGAGAMAVSMLYERPHDREGEAIARAKLADQIYAQHYMGAASVAAASHPVTNNTSTSSSQTNINGPITINTKATDAQGIARDMHGAIQNNALVAQTATGLN